MSWTLNLGSFVWPPNVALEKADISNAMSPRGTWEA